MREISDKAVMEYMKVLNDNALADHKDATYEKLEAQAYFTHGFIRAGFILLFSGLSDESAKTQKGE